MSKEKTGSRSFGAFAGVFIPTFLSIIGLILFLRLGYVVGEAGLLGALIIIVLSVSVSIATGLALCSIVSNIRIKAGGAYSIVHKTLGLEIGGSIGIPLYLAQTLSSALYLFGFAEAWKFLFPQHPLPLVAITIFLIVFAIVFISTKIAVKIQIGVFVLICIAIISVFLGGSALSGGSEIPASFSGEVPFWMIFAIFFPAVTGLMSGIGMSGELSDPKSQIPKGVIYGLLATTVIYIGTAIWLALSASTEALISNNLIIADIAISSNLVIAGILTATFSQGLTMLIVAPRVLQAMGENSILPKSDFFTKTTKKGEPRNVVMITGAIIAVSILLGSLNMVAQILTMFFLVTYAMINLSVFIEQQLGLRTFRPTFKVPKFVSLYGAVGSFVFMFLINPYACLIALIFIISVYFTIAQKSFEQKPGDVRSGLFRSLSEWATKKTLSLPESIRHIWKPNILIPVSSTRNLAGNFPLIKSIAYPNGTMTVLGFKMKKGVEENPGTGKVSDMEMEEELKELPELVEKFSEEKIFTSYSTIDVENYTDSLIVSMEAIDSQVFAPNILFLPYKPQQLPKRNLERIIYASKKNESGLALFDKDRKVGLGAKEDLHVWISPKALKDNLFERRYYDLALLIAYSIKKNWNGKINIWMCVDKEEEHRARTYLDNLVYEARFPESTEIHVVNKGFERTLKESPDGDIHIIPFEPDDTERIIDIAKIEGKSYFFVLDSTKESILA